jgi:hypothetical protein
MHFHKLRGREGGGALTDGNLQRAAAGWTLGKREHGMRVSSSGGVAHVKERGSNRLSSHVCTKCSVKYCRGRPTGGSAGGCRGDRDWA